MKILPDNRSVMGKEKRNDIQTEIIWIAKIRGGKYKDLGMMTGGRRLYSDSLQNSSALSFNRFSSLNFFFDDGENCEKLGIWLKKLEKFKIN